MKYVKWCFILPTELHIDARLFAIFYLFLSVYHLFQNGKMQHAKVARLSPTFPSNRIHSD